MIAAFIDVEGAFNNVDPNVLLREIRSAGIPAHIRKFITNLTFKRRNFFVRQGNLIGSLIARKSTSQGFSLSPLLFDICNIGLTIEDY